MALRKALLIPDSHIPYQCLRSFDVMLKVAVDIKPDEIVILGDFADFYAVNSHGKHPHAQHLLIKEIEEINVILDLLTELFPKAKKVYIEGNHEYRLERFIFNNCPALFGITEWHNLLNLNQRPKWSYVPYGPNQLYSVLASKLFARHEPLSMSSAKASLTKSMCNLVYGHTHRREECYLVNQQGHEFVNFSVGWLGDVKADKIFGYTKSRPHWIKGFGIVYVDTDTGFFYVDKVHILENFTCVVNGKLYKP